MTNYGKPKNQQPIVGIAQLEDFGVAPRYINILENSEQELIFLYQLDGMTDEDLQGISGIGEKAAHQILQGIERYKEAQKNGEPEPLTSAQLHERSEIERLIAERDRQRNS